MSRNRVHRDGEREAQKKFCIIMSRTTITNYNNQNLTKGYKVTLYSDYLRVTALYTINRNSPNLGCPKGQCEYDHYTLVFDTHP